MSPMSGDFYDKVSEQKKPQKRRLLPVVLVVIGLCILVMLAVLFVIFPILKVNHYSFP